MSKVQIKIHIKKEFNGNNELSTRLKTIKLTNNDITYIFPEEFQNEDNHEELFKIGIVNSAKKALKKENHFRNVTVTIPKETAKLYMDEDGNFLFKDFLLEEKVEEKNQETVKMTPKNEGPSLSEIENIFVLDKFVGKGQNSKEWLDDFNKECARFKIQDEEKKIQCLKLFLLGNAKEWYISTRKKLETKNNWEKWSDSFQRTFADKGWSNTRYAYNFKHVQGYGSYVEYAIKKERLLLECEKSMTEVSRISHIVVGLPIYIQNKLDKEKIESTEDLINELQKYEGKSFKINKSDEPRKFLQTEGRNNEKRRYNPCHICTKLGKQNRYHPVESCWNKENYRKDRVVNLAESETCKIKLDDSKN